jgi:hypothetical protein
LAGQCDPISDHAKGQQIAPAAYAVNPTLRDGFDGEARIDHSNRLSQRHGRNKANQFVIIDLRRLRISPTRQGAERQNAPMVTLASAGFELDSLSSLGNGDDLYARSDRTPHQQLVKGSPLH